MWHIQQYRVYPIEYVNNFVVLCCGYIISYCGSIWYIYQYALWLLYWHLYNYEIASFPSEVTLKDMHKIRRFLTKTKHDKAQYKLVH